MEATTKRKRIVRELLATSDANKARLELIKKVDQLIKNSNKIQKELFHEPYKDWRKNEIIE